MNKTVFFRLTAYILVPVCIVCMPFVWSSYAAADTTGYDWYFKPTDDHTQPAVIPEATFLSEFENVITMGNAEEKKLSLTFDAGYDNGNMAKILDTLKQKNISAAFFVDGNFVKSNPDLVKRICSEGHILGNHSLSHADMSSLTDFEKYKEQIEGWDTLVKEAGGTPSGYFRFPCGRFSRRALEYNKKLNLKTAFWSFAYYDWDTNKQPDKAAALNKIVSRMHNGAVLLLHSVSSTNAEILGELIDKMTAAGYQFVPLSEI